MRKLPIYNLMVVSDAGVSLTGGIQPVSPVDEPTKPNGLVSTVTMSSVTKLHFMLTLSCIWLAFSAAATFLIAAYLQRSRFPPIAQESKRFGEFDDWLDVTGWC